MEEEIMNSLELNHNVFERMISGTERQLMLRRLKELECKQAELEVKLVSDVIQAEDEVCSRIGGELHDSVGQMLTSVLLAIKQIDKKVKSISNDPDLIDSLDKARMQLNRTIEEVRIISHDLMPSSIYLFGLIDSIKDMVETLCRTSAQKISFYTNIENRLDATLECSFYRIVQEAVNNSLKYSSAENISIQIVESKGLLTLVIEDDGVGFEMESVDSKVHLGLITMKRRAISMKGVFSIEAAPGRGTVIIVDEVPVKYSSK